MNEDLLKEFVKVFMDKSNDKDELLKRKESILHLTQEISRVFLKNETDVDDAVAVMATFLISMQSQNIVRGEYLRALLKAMKQISLTIDEGRDE